MEIAGYVAKNALWLWFFSYHQQPIEKPLLPTTPTELTPTQKVLSILETTYHENKQKPLSDEKKQAAIKQLQELKDITPLLSQLLNTYHQDKESAQQIIRQTRDDERFKLEKSTQEFQKYCTDHKNKALTRGALGTTAFSFCLALWCYKNLGEYKPLLYASMVGSGGLSLISLLEIKRYQMAEQAIEDIPQFAFNISMLEATTKKGS